MKVGDIVVYEGPDPLEDRLQECYYYVFSVHLDFPPGVIALSGPNTGWSSNFPASDLKVVGEVVPPLTQVQVFGIANGAGNLSEELKRILHNWLLPPK